jgi:hypothetical protein
MDILNFISWIKGKRVVTTVDPTKTLIPLGIKDGRRDDEYLAGAITYDDLANQIGGLQTVTVDGVTITGNGTPGNPLVASGGGLEGTQYVFVQANGTDTENATELQAAYTLATTMSPSATNRITIVAAPGNYNFGTSAFVMDTQYIDLVSLDGNRSIIFNSSNSNGTISITANDVFVKGVNVLTKNFTIGSNLNLLKVENCQGGNFSFGGDPTFGSNPIIVSGTFTDCVGGDVSFGYVGIASGTFNNCVGEYASFGGDVGISGPGIASGKFTNCVGDAVSFGGFGTASGTFTNCQGGNTSFGGGGTLSGKLYYCRLTSGTFQTVSGGGRTIYCIDGVNNTNNQ